MEKFNINKQILLAIYTFILFVAVVSVAFLYFNPGNNNDGNPGGTGGDYTPPNELIITNKGIIYKYFNESGVVDTLSLLETAVLYDISITNNPDAPSTYKQRDSFDISKEKMLKKNASYTGTIDDGAINSVDKTPWYYEFTLTIVDGRKFKIQANISPENEKNLITIQKLN